MSSPCADVSLRHINAQAVREIKDVLHSLEQRGKDTCELEINCAGGDVVKGLEIVRLINESPVIVNATIVNETGSMAAVILQYCNTRRMMRDATLHYHYGSWRVSFLIYYDQELFERNRKRAMEYQEQLISPLITRVGMTEMKAHELLRMDKKMNAEESLSLGLIDEIIS